MAADRDQSEARAERRLSDREHAKVDRDHSAADSDQTAADRHLSQVDADQRSSDRDQVATDGERAAADREQAAADRVAAAHDREQASAELRRAQIDPLTDAFGHGLGLVALEREINRARHGSGRLTLAYIDVDGLKQVNDRGGQTAGDALLRDVAGAM